MSHSHLSYSNGYWNPNVFYEIGLVEAFNKDIIMFLKESQFPSKKTNTKDSFPFDISSHNCIKLTENKNGIEKLIEQLKLIIK